MGAALGQDRIGTLSHSSGIVTLSLPVGQSFNVITIGGQQYRTGSLQRTIATDVTLVANTLYMVFAVLSGGAVQLRISSNFNSLGPTGFAAWKLVGAFYSNGRSAPAFGSSLPIEGVPETSEIGFDQTVSGGITSISNADAYWIRRGREIFVKGGFVAPAVGLGDAQIRVPTNLNWDNEDLRGQLGWYFRYQFGGFVDLYDGSYQSGGIWRDRGGATNILMIGPRSPGNSMNNIDNTNTWLSPNDGIGYQYRYHVSGWSNTPVKDL